MMRLRIDRSDGGVTIGPTQEELNEIADMLKMTLDDAIAFKLKLWASQANPEWLPIINAHFVDEATLPLAKDGTKMLRNAWRHDGDDTKVDMDAGRSIVMDQVRSKRDEMLTKSDADYIKLSEIGTPTEKTTLATYRQSLRDFPATLTETLANLTVEQLHDFQPSWPTMPDA